LLQLNAVVGLTGFFNDPRDIKSGLKTVGIQCALCHSTVDDSLAPGIGHRLDGWANQDLNVGAVINLAPDLSAVDKLLGVDDATLRKVLTSWGPGKFDAEVFLDGKGFRPDGKTAATLIPNAFGLAGHNNHTWTGAWGTVTYWNAFVANLEMHGAPGTFFDPRLDNVAQFPVAARAGFGHLSAPPDQDRITPKLAALHFYQLAIPSPKPPAGSFDQSAAERGRLVFNGAGKCAAPVHRAGLEPAHPRRGGDRLLPSGPGPRPPLPHRGAGGAPVQPQDRPGPRLLPRRPLQEPAGGDQPLQRLHAPGIGPPTEERPGGVPEVDLVHRPLLTPASLPAGRPDPRGERRRVAAGFAAANRRQPPP
jgi:hypothetical protein